MDQYANERQTLLNRLLDAVKQCQVRFGGKSELAIDTDSRVSCLCVAWEAVLQHGLRHNNKALSTLKQVTELTGLTKVKGVFSEIKNLETEPVFWLFVKEHLNKHEVQRFIMLKKITTDAGRGRAWLRSTFNEHSLERYLHMLLGNNVLLNQYYEDWSFIRDEERSSMTTNMAAGLGSIWFALNIDNEELNKIRSVAPLLHTSATPQPIVRAKNEPSPVIAGEEISEKKDKKKRKKLAHIIAFDDEENAGKDEHSSLPKQTTSSKVTNFLTHVRSKSSDISFLRRKNNQADQSAASKTPPASPTLTRIKKFLAGSKSDVTQNDVIEEKGSDVIKTDSDIITTGSEDVTENHKFTTSQSTPSFAEYIQPASNTDTSDSLSNGNNDSLTKHDTPESKPAVLFYQNPDSPSTKRSSAKAGDTASIQSIDIYKDYSPSSMVTDIYKAASNDRGMRRLGSNASFDSSRTSSPSICSVETESLQPSNLIPINSATGAPDDSFSMYSRSYHSVDSDIPSYSCADTENAALALAFAQKTVLSSPGTRTAGDGGYDVEESKQHDTMTTGELKQAVVAMMLRKDEVEEQNKSLQAMYNQECETVTGLKIHIEEINTQHAAVQEKDSARITALVRENDLLKHQLKKYVSAVQLLRREGPNAQGIDGIHLDEPQPPIPPPSPTIDYCYEASEYEKKLVQVAEMHGELMEFNELLHRDLNAKEHLIRRLKEELVSLRGPLPDNLGKRADDTVSNITDISSSSDTSISRPLIHIWIPSAFLRSASTEGYHVYQVYVRIKDEEWNVYKRYAQFYELHTKLKKKYPVLTTCDFPPKKTIGNKDSKFVEFRRKKLQSYLRKLILHVVQSDASLATGANREKLLEVLPFFGEVRQPHKDKKLTRKKSSTNIVDSNRRTSELSRRTSEQSLNQQHYNGL